MLNLNNKILKINDRNIRYIKNKKKPPNTR